MKNHENNELNVFSRIETIKRRISKIKKNVFNFNAIMIFQMNI